MISQLSDIPSYFKLKNLCQSIAMLDAIIMPEWTYRYYSFELFWDKNISVFWMRNGLGNDMTVIFTPAGILIKGFAHESSYSPYRTNPPEIMSGILEKVPSEFANLLNEPAFVFSDTTFCVWQPFESNEWHFGLQPTLQGKDYDGSRQLLEILDGKPITYFDWAVAYYEKNIPLDIVWEIYSRKPLNQKRIMSLNAERNINDSLLEANKIGYPIIML